VADETDLDALLDRIPVVAGRPRTVAELSGGLTNLNLRVTTTGPDGGDYVVRRFRGDPELLDIDRDAEHDNTVAAAESGVGAPFVDYRRDLGVLVIGYVDGVTFDNDSFDDPGSLARAGRAIRQLHDGPRFTGDFDMFTRQARYLRTVHDRGFPLPDDGYERHADAFARARDALAVRPAATVPCNNDLLAGNFVEDDRQVWLIDYEYSGNNDPCFELGNTSTECDLDDDQVAALVEAYAGSLDATMLARVRLQALVSAYGWSLWGAIQSAASEIDYDFAGWSREHFEKAARGLTSDGYDALLREVAGG
jgi:thiamine kinase-like enzyme